MNYVARIIIGISLAFALNGCNKENKSSPERLNNLNWPLSGEISTLDPANSYDTISATVIYQVYEQLYEYHYLKRPYGLKPLLAEEMPQVSPDGLKYTIKIKKNIKFHNNSAFNDQPRYLKAQDFITQIKRLAFIPIRSNGWWLFDGKIKGINNFREEVGRDFSKFKSHNISGLEAPDDQTLIITLNQPYPQMIYTLAMSFTSPMPIEIIEKNENALTNQMVGTGPYQLEEWKPSSYLKLTKNPDYHEMYYPTQGDRLANSRDLLSDAGKRLPFIQSIKFHIIKEAQTRWLNFKSKKVDLLIVPKDNYANAIDSNGKLKKELREDNIKLQIFPTLTYWWLSFNMKDPLLGKNKNLRLAIAHAVDVDRYIDVFTNNVGLKANSIYPPGISGYEPSRQLPYGHDIEKAKKYLKLAGFPNGKGLPSLIFDVRGSSTTNRQQAQFVKSELEKIGIKVDISLNTFPAFLEKARRGKLQFWQDGWAMDYPDAENALQLLATQNHPPGPNSTYYSNKRFDKLFEQLKLLSDGNEKQQLMREMEEIVLEDLPWVMQYYARNYILYNGYLKNFRHSDLIYNNIKYLKLD